jgi:hypothetical protein
MLPSEKAERWVRRIGYAALILIALYAITWLTSFIFRITRQALRQRTLPGDARAPADPRPSAARSI